MNMATLDSKWSSEAPPRAAPVDVQTTYAIVDELGRPTMANAILFSPLIKLTVCEGELINITLYATEEVAAKILASAKNSQDYHVVPYGGLNGIGSPA